VATLLETFDAKEIAFEWDGQKRVFRNNELTVLGDEDVQTWTAASRKRKHEFLGVWLIFEIASPFLQRISPSPNNGNDWIDVRNAVLNNQKTVLIYPIHDVDDTISYEVIPENKKKAEVFKVIRGMTYPEAQISLITVDQLDDYPVWLRQTRYRE